MEKTAFMRKSDDRQFGYSIISPSRRANCPSTTSLVHPLRCARTHARTAPLVSTSSHYSCTLFLRGIQFPLSALYGITSTSAHGRHRKAVGNPPRSQDALHYFVVHAQRRPRSWNRQRFVHITTTGRTALKGPVRMDRQ